MSKEIICADAVKWLESKPDQSIPNIITGICDQDEVQMDMKKYIHFFEKVATLIFCKLDPRGYAILIQTDRKYQKQWIDKSAILTPIAQKLGLKLVWHKIVLHRDVGGTDLHRPTYAHMLCYTVEGTSGAATPDVIPVSKRIYKNGTPIEAATVAVEFVARYTKSSHLVVDPFVGRGTIPFVATAQGLDAIGIDIDPEQVKLATCSRGTTLPHLSSAWSASVGVLSRPPLSKK